MTSVSESKSSDASTDPAEVPTIVVGFRRLPALKETLTAITTHHHGPIYVFLDHPRHGVASDAQQCAEVWDWVSSVADETPRMKVFRPEANLGVARAIPAAIKWTIDDGHERFIVVEEDCLPAPDFYPFMREMLARYAEDRRVGMVSGNQFLPPPIAADQRGSYYFSRYIHIWGWGSWSRSWAAYDHEMTALGDDTVRRNLRSLFARTPEMRFYSAIWSRQLSNPSDSAWASRWLLALLLSRALCICPSNNLVRNIGFDGSSTHTKRASRYQTVALSKMSWPLTHPPHVIESLDADRWWFDHMISKRLYSRVRRYLPDWRRRSGATA